MAKILEILKTENERKSTGDFNTVHLYKTGQFYTAYDWSAWIISAISYTDAVRNQTRDRRPLAVTLSNKTLERIAKNLQTIDLSDAKHAEASINSYLGVLSHSASYNIKQQLNLVA